MANRAEILFLHAATPLLPRGCGLVAAVSGGGDSVALLQLLVRLRASRPMTLTVAHLDHALRRNSPADRRFVERMARGLSLPFISERRPVASLRRRGESPEEAARRVRREFLMEAMKQAGAERIATGHTLDYQAETILLRLARGAGPTALAGIAVEGPGPFVRPLLGIERAELRAYLSRKGIPYREDPSNRSTRFDRNRVRRLVLPCLAEALNPRVARHLVEAAERLREDAACLDAQARAILEKTVRTVAGRSTLPCAGLTGSPAAIAGRLARLALERAGADPRRITSRHVNGLLGLARGDGGKGLDLPGGLRAAKRGRNLVIGVEGGRPVY